MHDEDMARYQQLLAANPRNSAALTAIADIHMRYARYPEAAAYYERAIEVDPDHSRRERARLVQAQGLSGGRPMQNNSRYAPPPPLAPLPDYRPTAPVLILRDTDNWVNEEVEAAPAPEPIEPAPLAAPEPSGLDRWREENR